MPPRWGPEIVDLLMSARTVRLLSAVVPWEISVRWKLGKLPLPDHPQPWTDRAARELATDDLLVTRTHVLRTADLPLHHGDPFDRLLIAQAQVEGVPIVTADEVFTRYDVEVLRAR